MSMFVILKPFTFPKKLCFAAFLLTLISYSTQLLAEVKPQLTAEACANFGHPFDGSNDLAPMKAYRSAVGDLVRVEDFAQLDCIADSIRSQKARFAGGGWQLYSFYRGTSEIEGHATEEDWNNLIGHLQKWTSANPKSITARVALAEANLNFAWHARGDGFSDTVTASGWKLFGQRIVEAEKILNDASSLPAKCPHWYFSMLRVARGQGWDLEKSTDLLKQATAYAPDYYYYYRTLADYMLPKWEGQEGDASNFAEQSANQLGGTKGDILYFQIGSRLACACDEPEFNRLSWPRLQKGYEALEKEYGASLYNLNLLALMAAKNNDSVAADAALKGIGDNFDVETWGTAEYFHQVKDWASHFAQAEARSRKIKAEAEANVLAPDGLAYNKQAEKALASIVQACAKEAVDKSPFQFMLQIGADGIPKDGWAQDPTPVGHCVLKNVYDSSIKKEALFPKPPHPDYWLKLAFDPGVSVAAK